MGTLIMGDLFTNWAFRRRRSHRRPSSCWRLALHRPAVLNNSPFEAPGNLSKQATNFVLRRLKRLFLPPDNGGMSGSNFNPQNIRYIPVVEILVFLELEHKLPFFKGLNMKRAGHQMHKPRKSRSILIPWRMSILSRAGQAKYRQMIKKDML